MPTRQYSSRSARLSMRKLFTSCIRRGQVSCDSIVDRHWLPATDWCQRYLPYRQPASDVSDKFGEVSYTECTGQGNDFELIQTAKMEIRHPVEGSFGNEFSSIYNHCGVLAAWSRKTLKKKSVFRSIGKNDPLWENYQNSVPKGFIATPTWCVRIFLKFGGWPSGNR